MKKVLSLILALVMAMTALTGIALAEAAEETGADSELAAFLGMLSGFFGEEEGGGEESENLELGELLGMLGAFLGEEEPAEKTGTEAEEEDIDLAALIALLGDAFGKEEESAEKTGTEAEEEDVDLAALIAMLGDAFGKEEEPAEKTGAEAEEGDVDLVALIAMLGDAFSKEEEGDKYPIKAESIEQFYGAWTLAKVTFFGEDVPLTASEELASKSLIINEQGVFFGDVEEPETALVFKDGILTLADAEGNFIVIHLTETGICFEMFGILDLDYAPAE